MHFHLLPGVDDGPVSLEDSLALAAAAVADGTGLVVCTPHVELVDVATLPDRVRELSDELREDGLPLALAVGGEIRVGTELSDAELEILSHGPPGHRWVLLEAPLERPMFDAFHPYADELEARGYSLLIAHPERCEALLEPDGGLAGRLQRGARLQVNASSLAGAHGQSARDAAHRLVSDGMAAAIASDAHGAERPPLLSDAAMRLAHLGIDSTPLTDTGPRTLLSRGMAQETYN